jgi:hypothetical protein
MVLATMLMGTESMVRERLCVWRDAGVTTEWQLHDPLHWRPSDTFGVGEDPGVGTVFGAALASIARAFPVVVGLSALTVTARLRRRRSA